MSHRTREARLPCVSPLNYDRSAARIFAGIAMRRLNVNRPLSQYHTRVTPSDTFITGRSAFSERDEPRRPCPPAAPADSPAGGARGASGPRSRPV
ncbi:hypothetical protein EVAR_4316_1 [Eumeta japonica]|uniref:Uncharacterized protein n=1 Tax=Eumeta variegata TaxID=151549 RepID=A0A4C1VD08_EUMVA|nr:hypothetical protein EVAR_4316_1 [Eumeta japonica]